MSYDKQGKTMRISNNHVRLKLYICLFSVYTPTYYRRTSDIQAPKPLPLNAACWKK